MNKIIEIKKQRKKDLEHDIPFLRKLYGFVKNNDAKISDIEEYMGTDSHTITGITARNNITTAISNQTFEIRKDFEKNVKKLEEEYEVLEKYLKGNSFMERYGRQIIIGIIIAIASFLLGKLS